MMPASEVEVPEKKFQTAKSMEMRTQLYLAVKSVVADWRISQAESAKRLGVSRSVLNRIMTNNYRRASIDLLVEMVLNAGLDVSLVIKNSAESGVDVLSAHDRASSKGWTFDASAGTLTRQGTSDLKLTPREAAILSVLMRNPRTFLSRNELADLSGAPCVSEMPRSVDVLISRLKSKLRAIDTREMIKSERGKGYMFLGGAGFLSLSV